VELSIKLARAALLIYRLVPHKNSSIGRWLSNPTDRVEREGFTMPISDSVVLGTGVSIFHPSLVNLYGCTVGDDSKIGAFVEIQKGATVGARCKISSHTFICEGVTVEDEVFIGHGVMFTNDRYPRAANPDGSLQTEANWKVEPTRIRRGASIGSNVTIICGITIGEGSIIGAGAVVTKNVADFAIVVGVPARVIGDSRNRT
jgi:UDP-2-acetamido-3-amino-2,3-dideoxy-glucuronate N-acetyltransferase